MAGGGEGRPPRRLADNDGTTDSEAALAPPPACRTTWLVHVGKTGGTSASLEQTTFHPLSVPHCTTTHVAPAALRSSARQVPTVHCLCPFVPSA